MTVVVGDQQPPDLLAEVVANVRCSLVLGQKHSLNAHDVCMYVGQPYASVLVSGCFPSLTLVGPCGRLFRWSAVETPRCA